MNKKASVVLLRWKRPQELKTIVLHLKSFNDIFDEIIIWDNRKSNMCGYGRYLATLKAKNNIIYTQDDDCIVHNIRELFSLYDDTCIINNMKPQHLKIYKKFNHTLPGWGMIFNKSWIKYLNMYIEKYGIDDIFLRDTGRIFTGLVQKYKSIKAEITEFESACDQKISLWKQPCHKKNRDIVIRRINECLNQPDKQYNYIKI